jgi:hypothetical protein
MTIAREKHTPHERQIAKALRITDAQLDALLAVRAGRWPYAAEVLLRKGFAERGGCNGYGRLTEAGEALLKRARDMGF